MAGPHSADAECYVGTPRAAETLPRATCGAPMLREAFGVESEQTAEKETPNANVETYRCRRPTPAVERTDNRKQRGSRRSPSKAVIGVELLRQLALIRRDS
jgi:hypothetical protein